ESLPKSEPKELAFFLAPSSESGFEELQPTLTPSLFEHGEQVYLLPAALYALAKDIPTHLEWKQSLQELYEKTGYSHVSTWRYNKHVRHRKMVILSILCACARFNYRILGNMTSHVHYHA
ncbi:Protein of unknown function, partial [Cotesia congregata]